MKRWVIATATGLLMLAGGCASLSETPQQAGRQKRWTHWIDEKHFQVAEKQQYPATMVRTGSHSTAAINGGMATIVTP